jgi:hypothetical protein
MLGRVRGQRTFAVATHPSRSILVPRRWKTIREAMASATVSTAAVTPSRCCYLGKRNEFGTMLLERKRNRLRSCCLSTVGIHQDPALRWAQSNPEVAQRCLNPPLAYDFKELDWSYSGEKAKSLEGYLKWRRWSMHPQEVALGFDQEAAVALASHVLSTPLTLASAMQHGLHHRQRGDDGSHQYQWCCIGARAEASLPSVYWKEFLLLGSALMVENDGDHQSEGDVTQRTDSNLDVALHFVGPDIPPRTSQHNVSIPSAKDDDDITRVSSTISLQAKHRCLFHENSDIAEAPWDAFIFLNPGFGHPNLKNDWDKTLRMVLDGDNETSRVVMLTAHSEKDAARDAGVLSGHYGLSNVEYEPNPFASRITFHDPCDTGLHLVRPNAFVSVIRI